MNELKPPKQSEFRRLQGIGLLSGVAMTCLLVNLLVVYVVDRGESVVAYVLLGTIIAQPSLLAIWFTMSRDSLSRRSIVVGLSALALVAAWFTALLMHLDTLQSIARQLKQNEYWSIVLLPIIAVAGSLPMIGLRVFFGMRFVNRFEANRTDQPNERLTISRILMFTALVAFALAGTQIPIGLELMDVEVLLSSVAISSSMSFGIGLVIVVPMVLVTMRERGSWLTLFLSVIVATAAVAGLTALIIFLRRSRLSTNDLEIVGCVATFVFAGTVVLAFFLGGLRLLGYRIGRLG